MRFRVIGPDDPALQVTKRALEAHPEWDASLEIVPWPEYRDRLMQVLTEPVASRQAVFVPGHVWLPELAHAGHLAPLDPLLGDLPAEVVEAYDAADILPSVAAESGYGGRLYMLPVFSDGHILFYRADVVPLEAEAGQVPVVSPRKMAELAARAHRPPAFAGLALKAHPSEIFLDFLPFLWEEGGDVLDEAGQPAFAGEAGVRALRAYCSLRQYCPPETHTYGNEEIALALKRGEVAMATTWGGQAAPLFLEAGSRAPELYRAAVFPRPWNATWGIAVPANQPDEVKRAVLEVLLQATGPEQDRAVTEVAGSPVRLSSYDEEALARYPWLAAQLEMLKRAGTLPIDPRVGAFLGALYEAVYKAFTGEMSPEEALARAAETVREMTAG